MKKQAHAPDTADLIHKKRVLSALRLAYYHTSHTDTQMDPSVLAKMDELIKEVSMMIKEE